MKVKEALEEEEAEETEVTEAEETEAEAEEPERPMLVKVNGFPSPNWADL